MTPDAGRIVVVGSINMDLVVRAPHIPRPGETVNGGDLDTVSGGKGANQATAAARLGADCALVGCVGDDDFGRRLIASLCEARVDTTHVRTANDAPTGVAMIVVDPHGENAICCAPGANHRLTPDDVLAAEDLIRTARVCLLQLEVPIETVVTAIEICRRCNVETILDPAPAIADPPDALFAVDILTPNETESEMLTGVSTGTAAKRPKAIADALLAKGARNVVLKLGPQGAAVVDGHEWHAIEAHSVTAVDTTAAGDAFTAALGVGRARGRPLLESARLANAAGALACTRHGAQPSMPTAEQLREFEAAIR